MPASSPPPPDWPGSDRQWRVLELIVAGLSYGEVGLELGIAVSTVRTHAHQAYRHLGITGRGLAAAIAELGRRGWIGYRAPVGEPDYDNEDDVVLTPALRTYLEAFTESGWPAKAPTKSQRRRMDLALEAAREQANERDRPEGYAYTDRDLLRIAVERRREQAPVHNPVDNAGDELARRREQRYAQTYAQPEKRQEQGDSSDMHKLTPPASTPSSMA